MKEQTFKTKWVAVVGIAVVLFASHGFLLSEEAGKATVVSVGDQHALPAENRIKVPVVVETETDVAGLQMRVRYDADSMTPDSPQLTERSEEMTVGFNDREGEIVFLMYSVEGKSISPGDGPVVMLPFILAEGASVGEILFEEIILAGSTSEAIPVTVRPGPVSVGKQVPTCPNLAQNHPNPFNPETSIQYSVISDQSIHHSPLVTLKVYNILGQEVVTLVDEPKEAGHYTVTWDGKDNRGLGVASGVYFYSLKAGDFTSTKRMVLLR